MATVQVMRSLGVHIALENSTWVVKGNKKFGLKEPSSVLDCKNSGTTIRLMAGMLSAMPFMSILDGTDQIKSRPMDRVVTPLCQMGAHIYGRSNNRLAPLVTLPAKIRGTSQTLAVKSAQVKSAIIMAALFADGATEIFNTMATRDHTERMLGYMGAEIKTESDCVMVQPLRGELKPLSFTVPGDISSAAFMLVAGALAAPGGITLKNVLVNQTRTGIIDALITMGARISIHHERTVCNEAVADISVTQSALKGATFSDGDHIVRMIDEIPILALAATQSEGITEIRNASELKVKETNRIARTVESLRMLGANIEATDDGMIIHGKTKLHGAEVSSFGDHRMALVLAIAGLISKSPVTITNAEVTDDSFPGFLSTLITLGANAIEI